MTVRSLAMLGLVLFGAALAGCGGGSGGGGGGPGSVPYVAILLHPDGTSSMNSQAHGVDPTGVQQGGVQFNTVADPVATTWDGTKESFVDLGHGEITDVGGGFQVGFTGVQGAGSERAVLWMGTEASRVELHPTSYSASLVSGGNGAIQGGYARAVSDGERHAVFWTGSAASVVDLHPAGHTRSRCYDVDTGVQGGTAFRTSDNSDRALLWSGTAASFVDLGPGLVWAMSGGTQVGQGPVGGGATHAFLWSGTEASRVDLHPAGFSQSRAFGVANGRQVGNADLAGGSTHAIVWSGTAASAIDLHPATATLLIDGAPPAHSFAAGIDNAGNIVGSIGNTTGRYLAVMWVPIP